MHWNSFEDRAPVGFISGSPIHYNDVIVSAMASQITSLAIVYSTVYSGAEQRRTKLRVTGLCEGNSLVTGKYFMWIHYERLHNHNKAKHNKTVCIFLGIYCNCQSMVNQSSSCGFVALHILRRVYSFRVRVILHLTVLFLCHFRSD